MADETKNEEVTTYSGGPGDGAAQTPPADETPKPLYKGLGGHITTTEELVKYAETLEEKLVSAQAKTPPPLVPAAPAAPDTDPLEKEIAENWYSNPTKAMHLIDQRFERKLEQTKLAEESKKQWFEEFYTENPDLKDHDRVVQLVIRDQFSKLRNLSPAEAKKAVSKEVKTITTGFRRDSGSHTTDMDSRPAVSLGSSRGEGAPRTPAAPKQPETFASQILKMRNKRKV
jgi:hypothetical protein